MPAFTTNQWAILVLVLVLGWLLGLASRSGGRKWRREYDRERAAHLADVQERDSRIAAANTRIAALEQQAAPVETHARNGIGAGTAGAVGAAATGTRDDLTVIRGIDRTRETALNDAGVHGYRDLAALSAGDLASLERRLAIPADTAGREHWREQAALLRDGQRDEWTRRFG